MAGVKLVVIYPRPLDEAAFERIYRDEHMPMVEEKMQGLTRFVVSKVLSSPQGQVAAYRLAEVHFSSMDDLNKAAASEAGQAVIEHARKISTGGTPLLLICDEQSFVYW